MKFNLLFLILFGVFPFTTAIHAADNIKGQWLFDNFQNRLEGTRGSDLELFGNHEVVQGVSAEDGAVRIASGSYYKVKHGITPNGGGNYVNEYSLVMDIRIPANSNGWKAIFNSNAYNSNAAECFISPNGAIGIGSTGYSKNIILHDEWYRVAISIYLGSHYTYYVDGQLVKNGISQAVDGSFSLDPVFLLFADSNMEDDLIDVSSVTVFDKALDADEVKSLGGFGHIFDAVEPVDAIIHPFLQSPSSNSATISWHADTSEPIVVKYGRTKDLLDQHVFSTSEVVEVSYNWHTSILNNLDANTIYYYQIETAKSKSKLSYFKTLPTNPNETLRFLILGDTQDNINNMNSVISGKIEDKLSDFYGADDNGLDFIIHVGDLVGSGSTISQYKDQFFTPFASLFSKYPTLITPGNHELEHPYFYKYIHNDSISAQPKEHSNFERYWAKQIGRTLLVGLNSTDQKSLSGIFDEQIIWLQGLLDSAEINNEIDFVFCFVHAPVQSELWANASNEFTKMQLLPLLKRYSKVQQLTSGHTHGYERGAIQKKDPANTDLITVIAGGGGSDRDRWGMFENNDYDQTHKSLDHHFYILAEIDQANKRFTFRTFSLGNADYFVDNECVDSWTREVGISNIETPQGLNVFFDTESVKLQINEPTDVSQIFTTEFRIIDMTNSLHPIMKSTKTRDLWNYYGVSDNYIPFDKNNQIDIFKYVVPYTFFDFKSKYCWAVRFKSFNGEWSPWSDNQGIDFASVGLETNKLNEIPYLLFNRMLFLKKSGEEYVIYDINGSVVTNSSSDLQDSVHLNPGFYILKINNNTYKLLIN